MFTPDQNRQQVVFDRLRQGILAGALPAGARLPPTRALADELGVARQTVVLAYERLVDIVVTHEYLHLAAFSFSAVAVPADRGRALYHAVTVEATWPF